jgi:hypothetical protein
MNWLVAPIEALSAFGELRDSSQFQPEDYS